LRNQGNVNPQSLDRSLSWREINMLDAKPCQAMPSQSKKRHVTSTLLGTMRILIGLLAMVEALTLFSPQQQTVSVSCEYKIRYDALSIKQHVSTVSFLVSHLAEYPEEPWLVRHSLH
jgi:hypothetical protein